MSAIAADMIAYLINNGANVNSRNAKGATALDVAYAGGHYDIVQLLLSSGASTL